VGDFIHALDESMREDFPGRQIGWGPTRRFARVIEIEHGGDGVHAETVDVDLSTRKALEIR